LNRRDVREDLPYPKERLRLPVVLSPDEVLRPIACAKNLYHHTLLLTLYRAGLRRSEVCHLNVRDIDSQRVEGFPDVLKPSALYVAGEKPHVWAAAMDSLDRLTLDSLRCRHQPYSRK
jgi:integrase